MDVTNKDFISDHCIIEWKFQVIQKIREKRQISRRHLNNIDEKKFKEDLEISLEIDAGKTLQQNYNNYMEAITKTMNKHAPLITKTKTKKDHNPWFGKDSQRLKTQQRMAERRWMKSKNHEDLLEYKCLNTIYKKHLHHAKKTSILSELNDNKNKTRNLYNILRSLTKQKDENPMPSTGCLSDVPDTFADFFLNKIEKIREQFQNQGTKKKYSKKCTKMTRFQLLDKKEICNIIKNMNPTTCMTDPCDTKFLLRFKETILDAITMIENQSLTTGEFLDDWKMAIVRPLIKGPDLDTELKNYRPISNLSFLSKIVEKAAQLQLQEHFDQHSLLPKHQSAYRQHHSTETTLLNICDNILKNMEDGKCTSIVSLDLSATFDTVNHTILLEVLNCYFGITDHALSWISSYLASRRFQVQVGQLTSKTVEIDFSVPQGRVLGPILFNCYASTLMEIIPERKDSFLSGYADDHAIIHSFNPDDNNINQIIEQDIGKIKTWMEDNQLKMNDDRIHSHRDIG